MTDNIKKFLEEVSKNNSVQDKLIEANNDYFQTIINVAKEQGISLSTGEIALLFNADKNHDGKISKEELAALKSEELQTDEVDDDELANVAGGVYGKMQSNGKGSILLTSSCFCSFGGGGDPDSYQKGCGCFMAGAGELTDYGKKLAKMGRINYCGKDSDPVAMWCAVGGAGYNFVNK